jgi:hypothetical protein
LKRLVIVLDGARRDIGVTLGGNRRDMSVVIDDLKNYYYLRGETAEIIVVCGDVAARITNFARMAEHRINVSVSDAAASIERFISAVSQIVIGTSSPVASVTRNIGGAAIEIAADCGAAVASLQQFLSASGNDVVVESGTYRASVGSADDPEDVEIAVVASEADASVLAYIDAFTDIIADTNAPVAHLENYAGADGLEFVIAASDATALFLRKRSLYELARDGEDATRQWGDWFGKSLFDAAYAVANGAA